MGQGVGFNIKAQCHIYNMLHLLSHLALADYTMIRPYGRNKPAGPYKKIAEQNPTRQQESNLTNQQDKFDEEN